MIGDIVKNFELIDKMTMLDAMALHSVGYYITELLNTQSTMSDFSW